MAYRIPNLQPVKQDEKDRKRLWRLIRKARREYDAMTPEQREAHDKAQRESWMRGEMGLGLD